MDRKLSVFCISTFLVGLVLGWFFHFEIYESQLTELQLTKNQYESELEQFKRHSVLKINYDPEDVQAYYNIDDAFKIAFTSVDEYFIRGNITNLTYYTINKIRLLLTPRYYDGSLDVGMRIEDTEVELLDSHQTKDFSLFSDVKRNQPFDFLVVY